MPHYFIVPKTLDQTDDRAANRSLNFDPTDIGTINLGQTWQAVFRLNVLKAGQYHHLWKWVIYLL